MSLGKGLLLVALVLGIIATILELIKPANTPISSLFLFELSYCFFVAAFFVGI